MGISDTSERMGPRLTRRRLLVSASSLAVIAACAPATTSGPAPAATATASGPQRGGTFIYPTEDPPEVVGAYLTTGSAIAAGAVRSQIFSSLVRYDMKLNFTGMLAKTFDIS